MGSRRRSGWEEKDTEDEREWMREDVKLPLFSEGGDETRGRGRRAVAMALGREKRKKIAGMEWISKKNTRSCCLSLN